MRIYNPENAKFLSVDPLSREYPHSAPYAFAENGPIENIDRDGEERIHYTITGYNNQGVAQLKYSHHEDLKERVFDWTTCSFKTEKNQSVEYIIHSGVYHTGAVNGNLYSQEITFHYDDKVDFVKSGKKITKSDIEHRDDVYKWGDRIVSGLENVGEEARIGHVPGQNKGNAKHGNAAKKGYTVPLKKNGAPNFSGYLATVSNGQYNKVKISYTGSYHKDFAQADKLAGFTKEHPRPANTTWHHVEDYNSNTNKGTMELISTKVHKAATPHSGGVAQYRAKHGNGYRPKK